MPGHIAIYAGDDKYIDQAYCAIRSSGQDSRGRLANASANPSSFTYGIRYQD